jgi:Transposase and inactivated derivatives
MFPAHVQVFPPYKHAYENDVDLKFSIPGKPADIAFFESFNAHFREECLSTHWFLSLEDAKSNIEAWRNAYNESRPHRSLGYMTSEEYSIIISKNKAEDAHLNGSENGVRPKSLPLIFPWYKKPGQVPLQLEQ